MGSWGFVHCGPNEALVISGCCYGRPKYINGGRKFILPVVHRCQKLSLGVMTLLIESHVIYTKLGVPITITGVAQVKVQGSNKSMLAAACEQLLGKSHDEICDVVKATLEGHQRAIMSHMTVEEIYLDRKKFCKAVFDVASSDVVNMGISIVSFTLKDLRDDEGYLKALGLARTAQVKRDARVGEAEARKDAGIRVAVAEEEKMSRKYQSETQIAQAHRDFQLKRAIYDKDIQSTRATTELAYRLQAAETKQQIKVEEMQVKVLERNQEINVQELEIVRRERELDARVRKQADAEKYRLEKLAAAEKSRAILEAEAEAEAVEVRGQANAYAIHAKAQAEAEQMTKKAEAWRQYGGAAKFDMVLKALPAIAQEVATPLATGCERITMVSSGAGEGGLGAEKVADEVINIIGKLPRIINAMTEIDFSKNLNLDEPLPQ